MGLGICQHGSLISCPQAVSGLAGEAGNGCMKRHIASRALLRVHRNAEATELPGVVRTRGPVGWASGHRGSVRNQGRLCV